MNFEGKVVAVTGGSQGIGEAICKGFGGAGAKVAILDINEEIAQKVADDIVQNGGIAKIFKVNVMDSSEVKRAFDEILEEFGTVDVLINNAGVVSPKPFTDVTEKDFDFVMGVNLKGTFNTCKVAFPIMIEKKYGKIINIASVAGKRGGGIFGNTVYAASKAGVIGLTKGLAREGGPYGINVNAICPGPTNTSMIADFKGDKRDNFLQGIPLRRFAEPTDIANMAMFLASDKAGYITGEISDVDGGIMLD